MKYVFAFLLLLSGCAGKPVNVNDYNQQIGAERTAGVGEVFFSHEKMTGEDNHYGSVFNGDASRFDLAVKSVSKDTLELEYSEYMKPVAGAYGGYRKDEPWMKKASFNKSLKYDLKTAKTIDYENYSFKILDVKDNKITYQRVK